jgi:hypothetical protein
MTEVEVYNSVKIERQSVEHLSDMIFFNDYNDKVDYSRCYIGKDKRFYTNGKENYSISHVASRENFFYLLYEIHNDRNEGGMFCLHYTSGELSCSIYLDSDSYKAKLKGLKSKHGTTSIITVDIEKLDYISRELYGDSLINKVDESYNKDIRYEDDYVILNMVNNEEIELKKKPLFDKIINIISSHQNGGIEGTEYKKSKKDIVISCKPTERQCYKCSSTKSKDKITMAYGPNQYAPFVYCKDCMIEIIENHHEKNVRGEILSKKL